MNKQIKQLQDKLEEAIRNRERLKGRYDAYTGVVEGQRDTLRELENHSRHLMDQITKSDNAVGELNRQLQEAVNKNQEAE